MAFLPNLCGNRKCFRAASNIIIVCGCKHPSFKYTSLPFWGGRGGVWEGGGDWQQAGCVLPETEPDDSCTPAFFQTRCVWPNPDQATQIGSGSVLHNMSHRMREVRSGLYDPARFWLYPKRFRIGSGMFTGIISSLSSISECRYYNWRDAY